MSIVLITSRRLLQTYISFLCYLCLGEFLFLVRVIHLFLVCKGSERIGYLLSCFTHTFSKGINLGNGAIGIGNAFFDLVSDTYKFIFQTDKLRYPVKCCLPLLIRMVFCKAEYRIFLYSFFRALYQPP